MLATQLAPSGAGTPVCIEERVVELLTGTMHVQVHAADCTIDEICGFAARRNPKRGFLFVSKVLGKHIPVVPAVMRATAKRLADKIPADLPGPIVFFGMAETAICLGQLVFEEYFLRTGRPDLLFIHSTRYRLNREVAVEFKEPHSHAADHIIYEPVDESDRRLLAQSCTHVYVDDEASTGTTFVNLAKAWAERCPNLSQVVLVVLTDWRGPERKAQMCEEMPVPSRFISLLAGKYSFTPKKGLNMTAMPKAVGSGQAIDHLLRRNHGRLGCRQRTEQSVREVFDGLFSRFRSGERCLVLGTGEFTYVPFRVAEMLEQRGHDVHCQSTTRSPIMEGNAIGCSHHFVDNYGDGIDNFVYNVRREDYDRIFILSETTASNIDPRLVDALGAYVVEI